MTPETHYAHSGELNIAYQVVGGGALDVVLVPGFVSHVELGWEEPRYAHFLTRLASFSRLILFDKRGTGMSDPVTVAPTMAERMDDIRAVMAAAGSSRAAIFGISEGGSLSLLFSLAHRDMCSALVLYGSWARRVQGPGYPWGMSVAEVDAFIDGMGRAWATGEWWRPTPFDDDAHRRWWARYLRTAASPAMAQKVLRMNIGMDLRDRLADIDVPTLILHRTGDQWIDIGHARHLAAHIPGAKFIELDGEDHRVWLGDVEPILESIEVFLTGRKARPRRRARLGAEALSRREREVAVLAARGETAARIAARLFVSERTVESHLSNVYAKVGVRSKAELIRRAGEFGF